MKKSNSKLSKNEPENMPQIKITWHICKGIFKIEKKWFLIDRNGWII